MNLIEYPDRDMACMRVADVLAGALKQCLLVHPVASFAVPGGTTPGPVFDVLSAADLAWERVTIMLTDERWVPDTHARSNAGLILDRLLQGPAAKARFMPFYREGLSAAGAAPLLSEEMAGHLPLSLLLLGMGADRHTASLFPGATGLAEAMAADAPAVCAIETESQAEPRITLSAPVLKGAMDKHLVIFGEDKRRALEEASGKPPQEAPIRAVLEEGQIHWAA